MREKGVPNRDTPLRNVDLIKENATVIFHVTSDGEVSIVYNDEPRLDVLAVIGPYNDDRWNLEEAVLLEVGFGYTRPYNEVHIPPLLRRPGEPQNFTPRYRGFSISPAQYKAVAHHIFEYIEERAANQVAARTDGWRPYKIRAFGHKNSGTKLTKAVITKKNRLASVDLRYNKPPMVRFGASMSDPLLVSDLYWAELYGNPSVTKQFEGIAKEMRFFLKKAYNRYKITPKSWMKSNDFANAARKLERFSMAWGDNFRDRSYLQKILLRDHIGETDYYFEDLAATIKWKGEPILEDLWAKDALSEPKSRLNDIQIRIWRRMGDLLSFDVYPKDPEEEHEIIPF